MSLLAPRNPGMFVAAIAIGVACLTAPTRAQAAVDLGVGLIGTAGGNFLDKPDLSALEEDFYPGFGGFTAGGGLMLDARVLKGILGIEVDVLRTTDRGRGTATFGGQDFTLKLGQSSWHVPILAKITLPAKVVAPAIYLGPELVFPGKTESTVTPDPSPFFSVTTTADTYWMITAGFGVEIKLPLPVVDIRIPVGIRGSYAPSLPSDRIVLNSSVAPTAGRYRTEWKYAVGLTAGAAIYF